LLLLMTGQGNTAELLMFERRGCPACLAWEKEIAPAYSLTAEGRKAPLRRIRITDYKLNHVTLRSEVLYTPTFALVERGREIGRIVGYSNDDAFWGLLTKLVELLDKSRPEKIKFLGFERLDTRKNERA